MKRKDVEDYLTPQEQAWLRHPSDAALVEALEDVTAHLAAAISLLSRSPKTGAASNKMFDQMLVDYDNSAARGRAALAATKALAGSRAPSDAALVEALERLVVNYGEPHPLARAHLETEDLRFARAALAAAKGQPSPPSTVTP